MNRNFYLFGSFIYGLLVGCLLIQSIIHLLLNHQMFFQQHFASWFLAINILSVVASVVLLIYFRFKKYRFAFFSGIVATLFSICYFIVVYLSLVLVTRELETYSLVTVILSLVAAIVFDVSIITSGPHRRPWLKIAGIVLLMVHGVYVFTLLGSIMAGDIQVALTLEKVRHWTAFLGIVPLVCFILNFQSELRAIPVEKNESSSRGHFGGLLGGTGLAGLLVCLYLGVSFISETYWTLDWNERGPVVMQAMAEKFENRLYIDADGDTLQYLWLTPKDHDPDQKYPLVVCLHGGSWRLPPGSKMHIQVPEPAPLLSSEQNRERYPAFLFVPQAPRGHSWGGDPPYPSADSLVVETIHALEGEFSVDTNRIYVAGGSGGGYGTWHLIGTRPKMFAAALPFCGAGDTKLAENMVNVPVWAFHGSKDRNVPVTGSREMIDAIKAAGGDPRYTEFPYAGHNVWQHIQETPGVFDWMFAQKRE